MFAGLQSECHCRGHIPRGQYILRVVSRLKYWIFTVNVDFELRDGVYLFSVNVDVELGGSLHVFRDDVDCVSRSVLHSAFCLCL